MEFSEVVKYVREKLELSQEDLARELNVSFATVNRWENKQSKPSRLGKLQFDKFYEKMILENKIKRNTFKDT
jgi:putative transcriptional regulator